MSDLVENLDWLRAHDDAARRVGERGRALAESLDFEGELKRAGRVVTAAIRYFPPQPEKPLTTGLGAAANACLREGWDEPGDAGVPALGTESRIELPRPVAMGDFVLMLDVSPFSDAQASPVQRVTVVANGEVLHQAALSTRQVLVLHAAPAAHVSNRGDPQTDIIAFGCGSGRLEGETAGRTVA